MNVNGTPDLLGSGGLSRAVTEIRRNLERASTEAVTGEREDLGRTLGARAGELDLINKALSDLEANKTRLSLTGNRLRQTGAGLSAIRNTIDGLGERAVTDTSLGGGIGTAETVDTARSALDQVLSTLNTQHSGRSLFAGDAVDGPAVATGDDVMAAVEAVLAGATDETDASARIDAFFAAGGGYDTLVYLGGAGEASAAALGDGSSVRFEAKADSAAIRSTIEGLVRLSVLEDVPTGGDHEAWVLGAFSALETGEQGLIELEARNGLAQNRVSATEEAAGAERLILTGTRDSLVGRDVYEAASEVERLEIQLEAAYAVTARLSRLTLTDFIR